MQWSEGAVRAAVRQAHTIVVKVGSSSLSASNGRLDPTRLAHLVRAIAEAAAMEARIVLVSSGAIATGFGPLGFEQRPGDVPTQQAAASVGQGLLMAQYEREFSRFGIRVGQILLTAYDTVHSAQYRNAQRTLRRLLDLGVIPIVNENDVLASNEIRFGDNDRLSALVANIVRADALILLTDVDGLYDRPPTDAGAQHIAYVPNVTKTLGSVVVGDSTSGLGTGGMHTKLEAVRVAARSGIPSILTTAANAGPALMGDTVGTAFAPLKHKSTSKRLWIGFASHPRGSLIVDDGAKKAILGGKASLLAAGVTGTLGEFSAGDPIFVVDSSGKRLAKGLAAYDSEEVPQLMGKSSAQLEKALGAEFGHPIVHRDDLVLL